MKFQRVLVTNDDGLEAPGLASLVASLSSKFTVDVIAPDRQRSGVGHGFTLFNPLRADSAPDRFPQGLADRVFRCSGLPADCVKIGIKTLLEDRQPDLVVSGVNHGANMGSDVIYSGTVGAAREAIMLGIPAMAVSLVTHGPGVEESSHPHFSVASDWATRLIQELEEELSRGVTEGYLLNVNVASRDPETVQDWAYTSLAKTRYDDRYVRHTDGTGRPHFWLEGDLVLEDERPDCDVAVVREGKVSVSPVTVGCLHSEALARLRDG